MASRPRRAPAWSEFPSSQQAVRPPTALEARPLTRGCSGPQKRGLAAQAPNTGRAMLSCPSVAALWTTRHTEYLIVVDPDSLNEPLSGVDVRMPRYQANSSGVREPKPPSAFSLKLDARNEQLEDVCDEAAPSPDHTAAGLD